MKVANKVKRTIKPADASNIVRLSITLSRTILAVALTC